MGSAKMGRVVVGAAVFGLAALLCVSAVAYYGRDASAQMLAQDNSVLGSAATLSSLMIHIKPSTNKYRHKTPSQIFDRPAPTKIPLGQPCPPGDVFCEKLTKLKQAADGHAANLDGITANGLNVFMPRTLGHTNSPQTADLDSNYFCGGPFKVGKKWHRLSEC